MSGGSFNYAYSRVREFADDLRDLVNEAGKVSPHDQQFIALNNHPPEWYAAPDYGSEVNTLLRQIVDHADKFAEVMRAVEWLYSGDSGPEYVQEAWSKMNETPNP